MNKMQGVCVYYGTQYNTTSIIAVGLLPVPLLIFFFFAQHKIALTTITAKYPGNNKIRLNIKRKTKSLCRYVNVIVFHIFLPVIYLYLYAATYLSYSILYNMNVQYSRVYTNSEHTTKSIVYLGISSVKYNKVDCAISSMICLHGLLDVW